MSNVIRVYIADGSNAMQICAAPSKERSRYFDCAITPRLIHCAVIHVGGKAARSNVTVSGGMSYRIGPRGRRIFLSEKLNAEYNIYLAL